MENFSAIKSRIKNFKNYLATLSPAARKKASPCFLIKREDIQKLLQQREDGQLLDGIRIYLGAEMIDNKIVPTLHALACHKSAEEQYIDFNVPEKEEDLGNCRLPLVVDGLPCPKFCSKSNVLNT